MEKQYITTYWESLDVNREIFYKNVDDTIDNVWERPLPDKWSVAETIYHLILMMRLFRRFSTVYIPMMYPLAAIRNKKNYPVEIHNIYKEYKQKKTKAMKAPFILNPPNQLEQKYSYQDLQDILEKETVKMKSKVANIHPDIAGRIYYPDPIAHHPNLIQSIQLLGIHEKHHFDLTLRYFE